MLAKVEAVGDGGEVRLGQLSTLERLDERIYRLKIAIPWPSCKIQGGSIMRIICVRHFGEFARTGRLLPPQPCGLRGALTPYGTPAIEIR